MFVFYFLFQMNLNSVNSLLYLQIINSLKGFLLLNLPRKDISKRTIHRINEPIWYLISFFALLQLFFPIWYEKIFPYYYLPNNNEKILQLLLSVDRGQLGQVSANSLLNHQYVFSQRFGQEHSRQFSQHFITKLSAIYYFSS